MTQRCQTLLGFEYVVCHSRRAAKAAQNPRKSPRVFITAYAVRVLLAALWHSGAMPAASTGQLQRDGACYGRVQCWGRGYGHLERYTDAYGVLERV